MPSIDYTKSPTLKDAPQVPEDLRWEKRAAEIDHALAGQINPAESLVVSGFWRSGTTWLQEWLAEILQAKTIFEPFHFRVPAAKKLYKYYGLAPKADPFRELFIPYCAEPAFEPHSLLYRYYDGALRADLSGHIVRLLRKDISESQRTRVVVKFTRGQFSLRAAQNTFAMPVIHVYRDPRAVIASAKMTDWYWLFDHLSLHEQLLEPKDGRADFFGRYAEAIREYDRDKISRMAAYWAITEKFLQHAFTDKQRRTIFVSYEELCRRPEFVLEILARLNVQKAWNGNLQASNGDSFSTSQQRRGASPTERISGWKKALSSAEGETIASIAARFGFGDRLEQ
jgi:hypothetical protein